MYSVTVEKLLRAGKWAGDGWQEGRGQGTGPAMKKTDKNPHSGEMDTAINMINNTSLLQWDVDSKQMRNRGRGDLPCDEKTAQEEGEASLGQAIREGSSEEVAFPQRRRTPGRCLWESIFGRGNSSSPPTRHVQSPSRFSQS